MKDDSFRHHYFIVLLSLAICLFLYIDSYLIPIESSIQKVQNCSENFHGRRGQNWTYTLEIKGKNYDIPVHLFKALNINDEVVIEKSVFTKSLQRVGVFKEQDLWMYETGYLRVRFGKFLVPINIIGCLLMLIFFNKIDSIPGRGNLSYALFIFSLILLFTYLDLDIF